MPPVPVYVNEEGEEISVFNTLHCEDENKNIDETIKFKKSIRAIINELPADQREVVIMRTYYDMSFKEIAEILDISEVNAKVRMHRIIEKLKKSISKLKL
jgi:RNA polymerase sigma-70 factor (ECF subfamily)